MTDGNRTIRCYAVHEHGGPEVLTLETAAVPSAGPGEVVVRHEAIGVNFSDVQACRGGSVYADVALPLVPGVEGAGRVTAVGPDVDGFSVGELVAYASVFGSYADERVVPAASVVHVPAPLSAAEAVTVLTQGLTAEILAHDVYPRFRERGTVLVHAAAGGVTSLLVQLLAADGVRVLATTSTSAKAEIARTFGAAEVFGYDDVATAVAELTQGQGVDAVFDGIGRDTFEVSLSCLRPRGCLVMFGEASGPPPVFEPASLRRGSLFLTRVLFSDYIDSPATLRDGARRVFDAVLEDRLRAAPPTSFGFTAAADALRHLGDRRSTGKILLLPD